MSFNGSEQANKELQSIMEDVHERLGVSDAEIVRALDEWLNVGSGISVRTYNRYRIDGIKNYSTGCTLYDFFSRGPERFRLLSSHRSGERTNTEQQKFLDSFLEQFSATGHSFDYNGLESFRFTYELYRRSWKVLDGKHFVRTLLRVDKIHGVFELTEVVKFDIDGVPYKQVDKGILFPYSPNFCALTNSSQCLKFFSINDCDPPPDGEDPVNDFRGNLMAVTGNREHPSFRIVGRRVTDGVVDTGHFHVDQFQNDPQMQRVFDYIFDKST